ncbi:MAG: hypothetical protein HFG28_04090 [Eubacterium sp.]|nr:hypothetical protein [Eubacterium sp.]
MKIAIEMVSMIIAITMGCIVFASIISSNNQVCDARDFYNVVVNRIEDSNCNNEVVIQCTEEAKEKGYDLTVKDLTIYSEQPSKFIKLEYQVVIPVFQLLGEKFNKQGVIEGYAR